MSTCIVCASDAAKYKCPSCQSAYCSIPCYKTHKDTHPSNDDPPSTGLSAAGQDGSSTSPIARLKQDDPLASRDPPSPMVAPPQQPPPPPASRFTALETSSELQQLFTTYPRLRAELWRIHDWTLQPPLPPKDDDHDYDFTNQTQFQRHQRGQGQGPSFVNRGGRADGGGGRTPAAIRKATRQHQQWTPEKGIKEGLYYLHWARERHEGGVDDFKQLVMRLCQEEGF